MLLCYCNSFYCLPGEQHVAPRFVEGAGEDKLILSDDCHITRALLNNRIRCLNLGLDGQIQALGHLISLLLV